MKSIRFKTRRTFFVVITLILIISSFNVQTGLSEDELPLEEQPAEEQSSEDQIKIIILDGKECVDGEVLISFKDNQSDLSTEYTLESFDSRIKEEPSDNMILTEIPDGKTVKDYIEELTAQDSIEYVQPNYIYRLDTTVNDPAAQLPNPDQWHLNTIDAFEAWDITMGSADIKVAVIDTGIDLDHPDLTGQVYKHTDTVDNDGSADDDDGHGTHVAGIIAANENNGTGVVGVAPNVGLIIADVFGWHSVETSPGVFEDDFFALTSDIIEGVNYSVNHGADVINMSLGDYEDDEALEQALINAVSSGIVCVASAGNDGVTDEHYPSDYPDIISVIWTDRNNLRDPNSNYGPQKDISAPGGSSAGGEGDGILSTYWQNDDPEWEYAYVSGTSMASPIVAATAALILSVNPNLTVEEVKDILFNTAVDLGASGKDSEYGHGRVDARAAVLSAINTVYSQGNGTSSNPYLIYTPMQLNCIRYFPDAHYRVCSDIDMGALMHDGTDFYNKGKGWEPIPLLSGSLDGDGYSINGLLCNRSGEAEVGLFERIDESAIVKNLSMSGHDITGSGHAGAIAAFNYGTIQNCHTDGSIYSSDYFLVAGGIAGHNGHEILGCSNAGSVFQGGGITGKNDQRAVIDSCINKADVTQGAGITCENFAATISNCANLGTILGGNQQTGGIAAFDSNGKIDKCYNTGIICTTSEPSTAGVGGIVGYVYYTEITNCYNVGKSYEPDFGSIAGYIASGATIDNCYNANYQTHNIIFDFEGGYTLSDSYFLYDGTENLGSLAKTSTELKMRSTYESYNFSSIWSIVEGERFAVLQGLPFTYISGFSLDKETIDVFIGQKQTLTPVFVPADATNKSILWSSNNENVAEVSKGVVTGVSTGSATITATTADGAFVDSCIVNVKQGVVGVRIDKEVLSLVTGTQGQLNASVSPSNANNKNVTWASEDEDIAVVTEDGMVTAIAEGVTTVTVTTEQGGLTDSCTVYVTLTSVAVTGVYLNLSSTEMVIGDTIELIETLNPANATNSNVTWTSSDESIATVVNGTVTARGVGSVTITVTTQEGGYTDICVIDVSAEFDVIVFPDDNLKQALINSGVDSNNTGVITQTEMAEVTGGLILSNYNISNVTGLEHAVNMTSLDLSLNNIKNINSLGNLTSLLALNLSNNDISDISSLSGLSSIKYLLLSENEITDLTSLRYLTTLTGLEMRSNYCANISPLAQLYNLESIDFEINQVEDISALENLTKLKYLNLIRNRISDITPLKNLTKLETLYLGKNRIKDIYCLRNMTKLKFLDISYLSTEYYNTISNFDVISNFTDLEMLWAEDNTITDISALSELTKLKVLILRSNYIKDISSLSQLANIYCLDLSLNPISDISALANLNSLSAVILSGTSVSDITPLAGKNTIQSLNISINPISDISILSTCSNLGHIDITNCMVEDISGLEHLSLYSLFAKYNELDISSGSEARRVIDALQNRGGFAEFDPQGNRFILAPGYLTNRTIPAIVNLKIGTTLAKLKQGLNGDIDAMDFSSSKGGRLRDSSTLTTGCSISLNTEEEFSYMGVVILGDPSCDGRITITDYTLARLHILDLKELRDIYKDAADINGDGFITIVDYTLMRLDILGLKKIH